MIINRNISRFFGCIIVWGVSVFSSFSQTASIWYNSDQKPISSAMSGGFLAPQFSSFDLNQDGNNELISFDRYSGIVQVWRSDSLVSEGFQLDNSIQVEWPVIESWLLVRDYNGNGIPDLFTQGMHGIAVYRGGWYDGILRFEKLNGKSFLDDSLLFQSPSGGKTNIYHAKTDIPVIEDIDDDGDLDIMTFELSGSYLYSYENKRDESGNELEFILSHKCWGYFVENQFSEKIKLSNNDLACPPPFTVRHAGSSSCLLDVNQDALPDLLLGDTGAKSLKILLNGGSEESALISKVHPVFPYDGLPAFLHFFPAAYKVDINQDTIPDVLIATNEYPLTDHEGLWAYTGTGDASQSFELLSDHWMSDHHIDLGQYSTPYFMNVNGDEWTDILIGYQVTLDPSRPLNRIAYFEALSEDEFQLKNRDYGGLSDKLTSGYRPYLTSGDVDGDGDLDLFIGMSNGTSYIVKNSSNSSQEFIGDEVIENWGGLSMIHGSTPELFDVDQDGDLDILAGNDAGTINLYRNIGDSQKAIFDPDLDHFPNVKNVGNVNTTGGASVFGRSAPRIIVNGVDTLLVSGSHKGYLFIYRINTNDLNVKFNQTALKNWPEWVGGNNRITFDTSTDSFIRMLSGNIAGGVTEYALPAISTNTSFSYNTGVKLFPNPVNSGQAINLTLNHQNPVQKINIVQPNGLKVLSLTFTSEMVQGNMFPGKRIPTNGWSPGIYFVEIIFQDKSRSIKKVIVQ